MFTRAAILTLLALAAASPAAAQARQPIPAFVVDLRGFTVGFGQDEITARDLAIFVAEMPGRGFGGVVTANVYPLRRQGLSVGASFEALAARGNRTNSDPAGALISVVHRELSGVAFGFSMNFGHRDGFSYISAGMGPMVFETWTEDRIPDEAVRRPTTLNFGGGARWFNTARLAFTFDVRFYETKPANTTLTRAGRERRRLLILGAGISIR